MPSASRFLAVAAVFLATVARSDSPPKLPSTEDSQVVHLRDVPWAPPKPKEFPAGAMGALVAVDPQTGASVGYGKFPAGAALPSHWHSFTEYTVLRAAKRLSRWRASPPSSRRATTSSFPPGHITS